VIISRPGLAQEDESEARRKPGPVNVAGAWTGTVDDSVDGAGTLDLDFSQKQAVVGGTWQYQTGGHDVTGTVAGKATADSFELHNEVRKAEQLQHQGHGLNPDRDRNERQLPGQNQTLPGFRYFRCNEIAIAHVRSSRLLVENPFDNRGCARSCARNRYELSAVVHDLKELGRCWGQQIQRRRVAMPQASLKLRIDLDAGECGNDLRQGDQPESGGFLRFHRGK